MHNSDFSSNSSDQSADEFQNNPKTLTGINVLKYLPEARKILEGHHYEKQITQCKYNEQLTNIPNFVTAKDDKTLSNKPHLNSRLVKLEQATFEHNCMKQKIKDLLERGEVELPEKKSTLWSIYGPKEPVYARFGLKMKKTNFANNLLPINDIHIDLNQKFKVEKHLKTFKQDKFYHNPDTIRFQSHFQSGNLLYAYRNQDREIQTYDLILQNDINTKGHNQWFFFKVTNTKRHNKIRFNIINFTKEQSMFSYGIKPLTFSEKQYNNQRIGWCRNGQKIQYFKNKLKRQNNPNKFYYTLSFQYYFADTDTVYFAPNFPYTFSQLLTYCDHLIEKNLYNSMISIKPLVQTLGGNKINVVTIGCGQKEIENCKVVWVIARQHPGETIGSFMAEGIINYLIEFYNKHYSQISSGKATGSKKSSPLDSLIFKVVPMVNIDGVIHGNTRSNLAGVDPNRMWKKSLKRLCPEVSALKKLIMSHKDNTEMILDLHSHSKKLGCFFYSNTIRHNPQATKIYPTLVCQNDPKQRFTLKNCRFRGGYETTARNVLFCQLQSLAKIYTVECSMLGYLKNNRIAEYSIADYHEMGQVLIDTFIKMHMQNTQKQQERAMAELQKVIFNDAESARSESSLSDDEYQQILYRNRKKNKKPKVPTKTKNNSIYGFKEQLNKDKKPESKMQNNSRGASAGAFKSPRTVLVQQKNLIQTPTNNLLLSKDRKDLSACQKKIKIKNILGEYKNNTQQKSLPIKVPKLSTAINTSFSKIKNKSVGGTNENDSSFLYSKVMHKPQTSLKERIKSIDKKVKKSMTKLSIIQEETKVNAEVQVNEPMILVIPDTRNFASEKSKSRLNGVITEEERQLCIIGSSLEEGNVQVYKNEVGAQITPQILSLMTTSNMKKLQMNSTKKSQKVPKILSYLSPLSSQPDQNTQIVPSHPRRLIPIISKKT